MAKLRERNSNFKNDASILEEVDLKSIVHKNLDFFKDNKENKVFKDLKDESYFKNLKRDIEENQGIENPVISFKDGTLVEGHSRIQILRELVEEGKIPKSYKVPTILFEGSQEEGTKRLILGNLNRFEIDHNTRTLLFARIYPGYFDPREPKRGETVSPPPTRLEISKEMDITERQVKNEKAIIKEAIKETKKSLDKLEPKDLKQVREKKNLERREKNQTSKEPSKTSQNPPVKVSKPSPNLSKVDEIKALKSEKKRLEKELKEVDKKLKKLVGK